MPVLNHPASQPNVAGLRHRALNLRRTMMKMASGKGEGYIAQGLGIADCLAALYFHELRYDPSQPEWRDRDRFLLSTGHYSIAMYAALAEAGYLSHDELPSYGVNGSRLPMSTFDDIPGVEIVGGSLGQGLGQAVGMTIGLRLDGSDARVFNELSDGELQEGSTWEAAMAAATFQCDNLVALIDCNGIQADGPVTVKIDPVADKFTAFGFDAGGDRRQRHGRPGHGARQRAPEGRAPQGHRAPYHPGKGIPTLMARERAHFVRVANDEWDSLITELETHNG